jgi:hypothetical protein
MENDLKKIIQKELKPLLIGIRNDLEDFGKKNVYVKSNFVLEGKNIEVQTKKGNDGYTPKPDKDYPSEKTVFDFIKDNLPVKGKDYFNEKDIKDIVSSVYALMPTKQELKGKDGDNGQVDYSVVESLALPLIQSKYKDIKKEIDALSANLVKALEDSKIPEISADKIRNKLESLQGNARLDAKAIKGLETYFSTFIATSSGGGGGSSTGGSQNLQQVTDNGAITTVESTFSNGLITSQIKASTSAGLDIKSNSGTDVVRLGAGGGAGATFYGGVNMNTTATVTTSLTTPLVIGGTGTTDDLILRTTSGVGTTGSDMIFQGGNNGATEFARFLNNGNFGIGTNNPLAKLVVNGTVSSGDFQVCLSVNNTAANGYSVFRIGTAAAAAVGVGIHQFNASYSGSGSYVANTTTISAFESGGLILHANQIAPIRFFLGGSAAGNEVGRFDTTGYLGLGTTSPQLRLHIVDTKASAGLFRAQNLATNGYVGFELVNSSSVQIGAFGVGNPSAAFFPNQMYVGTSASSDVVFMTNNTARLTILSGGNVGIGVTPTAKLHIVGLNTAFMTFDGDPAGGGGSPALSLSVGASSGGNAGAYMNLTGNFETWTSLKANNNATGYRLMRFGNSTNGVIDTTNGTFAIQRLNDAGNSITATPFQMSNSAPTSSFIITSTGNVGFGAGTTPSAVLHLKAGTATASTAPLKFTAGTNLTTAENGAMEYNGTNLFFTRAGAVREGVLTQSAVTTEVLVSDTSVTVNIGGTTYKLLAKA